MRRIAPFLALLFLGGEVRAEEPAVTLAAVGDILFARYRERPAGPVYKPVVAKGDPFEHVAPILHGADLVFGNLETPVMEEPATFTTFKSLTFRAEPADAGRLRRAGFDVVSLANNHVCNLGHAGAAESRRHLEGAGLQAPGAGADPEQALEPAIVEHNGVRVAFLAFTAWTNGQPASGPGGAVAFFSSGRLAREAAPHVERARAKADFVVVSLHWGAEYDAEPDPHQRRQARRLIDAGADLVLGHHPHVVQPIERYKHGVIAYSLGNFLFDHPELRQRRSVILRATLRGRGEARRVDVELLPILLGRWDRRPRPTADAGWRAALRALAPGIPLLAPPAPDERRAAR